MKIAKTTLTETHLIVTLSGGSAENRYDVRAVYIDKASNYGNAYSSSANKHTWSPEYTATANIIKITIPTYAPTYFTFTIITANEVLLGMYLNEFSLFKAKSKYLLAFDACCGGCCGHNSVCAGCNEKQKRYQTITYMLRLNLFYQSYINGNVHLTTKYYEDARRICDMDEIYFEYMDFTGAGDITSPNTYRLFNTLNTWIKNNTQQCEKQVLESLLINDLYSLIFGGSWDEQERPNDPDSPDTPTNEQMYYGYLTKNDVAEYNKMFLNTHDFSLLKESEVQAGISAGKIKKDIFKSKQFNMSIPSGPTCFFILIPASSSKKVQKFDGIGSFVPFQSTADDKGFESNGINTISIDGVNYKIYGENSNLEGERTIKIS